MSLSEVQSLEQGRRHAKRETAQRLARALDAELAAPRSADDDEYPTGLYWLAVERQGPALAVVRRDVTRPIAEHGPR